MSHSADSQSGQGPGVAKQAPAQPEGPWKVSAGTRQGGRAESDRLHTARGGSNHTEHFALTMPIFTFLSEPGTLKAPEVRGTFQPLQVTFACGVVC